MILDKINKALRTTVDEFNQHGDPSLAVAKVAADQGFTQPETKRLIESFNRARTIYHFESATDKTATFKLAEPAEVFQNMHMDPDTKGGDNAWGFAAIKHAAYSQPEKDYNIPDYEYKSASSTEDVNTTRDITKTMVEAKGRLEHAINTGVTLKMAMTNDVNRKYSKAVRDITISSNGAEEVGYKLAMTKEALHREGLEAVWSNMLDHIPNNLTIPNVKFARIMDTSPIDDAISPLRELGPTLYHLEKLDEVNKQAMEELRDTEYFMNKAATYDPVKTTNVTTMDQFFEKAAQDPAVPQKTVAGLLSEAIIPAAGPEEIRDVKENKKEVANVHRQLMLEELIATDPVLTKIHPQRIVEAYEHIMDVAPETTENKLVMSAMLRQIAAGTEGTLSPYDASQLAKLDALIKARGGSGTFVNNI